MPLDFLDGETPEPTDAPASDVSHEPAQDAASEPNGPARGPDGKFVSAAQPEPEPQPAPEPPAQAPVVAQPTHPEPGYVPISVVLDEREKRQALEAQVRAFQQMQAQQQQPTPDPYEDFQGYMHHTQQQMQSQVITAKLQMSQSIAADKFGEDVVSAADAWSDQMEAQQPGFKQGLVGQAHPYGSLVQLYQRHTAMSKLSDPGEVDQYLAWKAAQAQTQLQPAAASAALTPHATPPRSIAGLPSAGSTKPGQTPVGEGVAFDSVFKG